MKRDFPSLVLYTFGFLLLWEWLRPLGQLTNTGHMETFIAFILISFAISYLQMKWIWQSLIKLVYIFVSINRLHYDVGFFHVSWLKAFFRNSVANVSLLVDRQWDNITNEFRTFLFFILLWLMVYLLHYWLLRRQRIFIFFFMTLVYITVLDTFTVYSAKIAIVRTVVVGFAVLGMLTFYRITQKGKVNSDPSYLRKWIVPLAGMITLSVLLGMAAPKADPIWPDPVPFFIANNDKPGGEGNRAGPHKIGYGPDDSILGGPFIADARSVFAYEASGKTYWKMETKDQYTGKGWIASGSTPILIRQEDLVPVYSFPEKVKTNKESAIVSLNANYKYNFFMYPAGVKKLSDILPFDSNSNKLMLDTTNERISYYKSDFIPQVPKVFSLEYEIPKYKFADLKATTGFNPSEMSELYYKKYTWLPKNLPLRIKGLASEITAGKTNWFDKAKAIESYFGNSGFTYDQKNVAVPGTDDDYVDQFLFETKRGYCDNYSTSMAVMLRTLGIPTRWVKGFTGGEFFEYSKNDSAKRVYQVTNNNAHSWVEVFFPNQGWVAFEPTKGFRNEILINYDSSGNSAPKNQETKPAPVKRPEQKDLEDPSKPKSEKESFDFKQLWNKTKIFFKDNWLWIFLIVVVSGVMIAIIYRIRGKWFPFILMVWYRFKKKDETVETAYVALLSQLTRFGIKRKENQTLRNYASYIDSFFSTSDMTKLTHLYEQYIYHQQLPNGTWKQSQKLWENLIKKTIA